MDPVQLVGLPQDSQLSADRDQAWLLGELWKRLRTHGHAPLLVCLSDKPLAMAKENVPQLGVEPDFLICENGAVIYDCSSQREWTELTEGSSPASQEEAFNVLCKGLDIDIDRTLLVGTTSSMEVVAGQLAAHDD